MAMNVIKGVADYLTPIQKVSSFREKGILTPEEFVAAGDLLVYKCPTWAWASGEDSKRKSYLPKDKQFLVTRNVPCLRRARVLELKAQEEMQVEQEGWDNDNEGWVATHASNAAALEASPDIPDVPDIGELNIAEVGAEIKPDGLDEEDDIPDMDDFEEDNLVQADEATLSSSYVVREEPEDNIIRSRTYDLTITWDKYYQTPRLWLFGYDERGQPLSPEQVFEDISEDHAKKTVTIETHPHMNTPHASIHPCKHSSVMKKMLDRMEEAGKNARPDQYLFLFLKWMSAIVPTIEYDYTIEMDM